MDATFGRPPSGRVLQAIPGEKLQAPVINLHRDVQDNLSVGMAEHLP